MNRTGPWVVSIEYSLSVFQVEANFLSTRVKFLDSRLVACPDSCGQSVGLSHFFQDRYRYELHNVIADLQTGQVFVPWMRSWALLQESSSWPAYQVGGPSLPALRSLPRISDPVAIASGTSNYFHWLTEELPGLVRLNAESPRKTLLTSRSAPSFVHQSCELLNLHVEVQERFVYLKSLTLYGKGQDVGWLHPGDLWAFPELSSRVPVDERTSNDDLYISRQGYSRSGAHDEMLTAQFRSLGYRHFDPGSHDLVAQIATFRSARSVAGVHGAGLAGILFSAPQTPVLELTRPEYFNRCYECLAHIGGLRYASALQDVEFVRLARELIA